LGDLQDISEMRFSGSIPDPHRRNKKETKKRQQLKRIAKKNVSPHGLEDDMPWMHSGPGGDSCAPPPGYYEALQEDEAQHLVEDAADVGSNPTESIETILARNGLLATIPEEASSTSSSLPEAASPEVSLPPEVLQERKTLVELAVSTPPQANTKPDGEEYSSWFNEISSIASANFSEDMDEWVSHLENLIIMSIQVARAQSFTDVFIAIIAYIKMNSKRSVVKNIMQLIDEVTKSFPKDETTPHAWTGNTIVQKWELFKTNTIFTKISYLLSAAMSLSVCSMKSIEWSPFGLELIAVEAAKEQLKAVDVIDAAIATFTWFAETGYQVFEQRSLVPILYSDQKMKQFNEDCDWVLANAEQALAGNLGVINDFEKKVDVVLTQVCEFKQAKSEGPTALWLQKRYSELIAIKHRIVGKHRNTAIRFAPFGVGLTGGSGVGKSTLAKL
jgi:hypothetical protein